MPRTPSIRQGVRPVTGSVGRLRVDAPVQAFGGGEGAARIGQGISNLGAGTRAMGERQDRDAEIEKAKSDAEARRLRAERQGFLEREFAEEQRAEARKEQLNAERAAFNINQEMSRWVSEAKRRKGDAAFGIEQEFRQAAQTIIDDSTKDLSEQSRDAVKMSGMNAALRYERGVSSHERTEIERVNKLNATAGVEDVIKGATESIGLLDGYGGSFRKFTEDYQDQLFARFVHFSNVQGLSGDARDSALTETVRNFELRGMSALLSNMELDQSTTLAQLEDNVDKYKEMLTDDTDNLTTEDIKALTRQADNVVNARKAQIHREELEIDRKQRADAIDNVGRSLELIEGASAKEQVAALELARLLSKNPEERKMYGGLIKAARTTERRVMTAESKLVVDQLNALKAQGASIDSMNKFVKKHSESASVLSTDYNKMRKTVADEIDSRASEAFVQTRGMVKQLITDNKKLAKFLPGEFLKDKDARTKLEPKVAVDRAETISLILEELQRFFVKKPDAQPADGVRFVHDFLEKTMTDTKKDNLLETLRKRDFQRSMDELRLRSSRMEELHAKRTAEMSATDEDLLQALEVTQEEE